VSDKNIQEAVQEKYGAATRQVAEGKTAGRVNLYAIRQLASAGLPTTGLRSKSWDEFARPGLRE
jgi:hypothetical protein